jgi:hypothetical protein
MREASEWITFFHKMSATLANIFTPRQLLDIATVAEKTFFLNMFPLLKGTGSRKCVKTPFMGICRG